MGRTDSFKKYRVSQFMNIVSLSFYLGLLKFLSQEFWSFQHTNPANILSDLKLNISASGAANINGI